MVTRVKVPLEQPEYTGLLKLAHQELRNPTDQLRHILRQELVRIGYLPISYLGVSLRLQPTDTPDQAQAQPAEASQQQEVGNAG